MAAFAAVAGTACGERGADAQRAVAQAVQQATPAARRGAWHGTITVRRTASGDFPDESNNQFSDTSHSVSVTQTANFDVNGQQARASVAYSEETRSRFRYDYDAYTITGNQVVTISASGSSGEADSNLEIFPDGRYTLDFSARGIGGEQSSHVVSTLRCKPNKDPECVDKNDETRQTDPVPNLASFSGGVDGRIDPSSPNEISGTYTEDYEHSDPVLGRTVVSWSLSR